MKILLVFDEAIDKPRLKEAINSLRPGSISIFALTSNQRLICDISNICNLGNNKITLDNSAYLIDREVDVIRSKISKWSADFGEYSVSGKSIREWFSLDKDGVSTWWFSLLSEKNPAKTNIFFNIAQLQALDKIFTSSSFDLCIYSIYGTSFTKAIDALCKRHRVKSLCIKSAFLRKPPLRDDIKVWLNQPRIPNAITRALTIFIVYIFRFFRAVLVLGPVKKRIEMVTNSVLFISFFPSVEKDAADKGMLKNKYALPLQEKFAQMNKRIIWIWLYNFLDGYTYNASLKLVKKFKENGESNFFLYEFLTFKAFFRILSIWFRQIKIFLKLRRLISSESLAQNLSVRETSFFIDELMLDSFAGKTALEGLLFFELYKEVFSHFSSSSHCIYYSEMQAWEKALCAAKKIVASQIQTIAHIHSSLPINFFPYFHYRSEIPHMPSPDILACNGDLSSILMRECGFPNVKKVEAVRYLYLNKYLDSSHFVKKDDIVLIAGWGIPSEDKKLLSLFYETFKRPQRDFKVWLRGHPCLPFKDLLDELGINIKESGYIIKEDDSLEDVLKSAKILIAGSSTLALEALLAKCIVIIPSFNDAMFISPLQGFEKYYTKVYNPNELKSTVERFIYDNTEINFTGIKDLITQYWCLDASLKRWTELFLKDKGQDSKQAEDRKTLVRIQKQNYGTTFSLSHNTDI